MNEVRTIAHLEWIQMARVGHGSPKATPKNQAANLRSDLVPGHAQAALGLRTARATKGVTANAACRRGPAVRREG
jgi:hypothetical protein